MQILIFHEIRKLYRKTYKKTSAPSDACLMQKLKDYYSIQQKDGICFLETEDKQRECEKIVAILDVYSKIRHEKNVLNKYDLMVQMLSEQHQQAFPETIKCHKEYIRHFVDARKNKNTQMVHSFNALKTMLSLMDREIMEYSNVDLVELLQNKKFTSTTKCHAVWFLKYMYQEHSEKCHFNVEITMLKREKIKGEDDFYSPEEWVCFINKFFDVDTHLERAYKDCKFAKYWLYAVLHMSLTWRKADVLCIPALNILLDVEKYTLQWFEDHIFTSTDAQRIINSIKLETEQYCMQKTGAGKHFNIPRIALIPTAIAFIVCEQWRRKRGDAMLFGKFCIETGKIAELFCLKTDFSSLKANRTLLSFFNEKAGEINELSGQAGFLTSYMRSHKTTPLGTSDTTTIYLRSTYDETETISMGKQIIDRGAFGWLYHKLLEAAGEEKPTFRENTELIAEMRKKLTAQQIDSISGLLRDIAEEKDRLLDEIGSWREGEAEEKARQFIRGGLLSKTDDVYCMKSSRCPYPIENNCLLCRYSIPTTFSLMLVGKELKRLLLELGSSSGECRIDRIRMTYQIGRLAMILKEAIAEFGYEYIEAYIDYTEINRLMQPQMPKMIFLEELQNETE